ncbi:MAG TPA: tetratricopeptide repeat protein [Anaeromyxobacteraceae bacterium]|nr:tetratricopeptide repeat protein [Anaeromyxobacteraceae bacterium]
MTAPQAGVAVPPPGAAGAAADRPGAWARFGPVLGILALGLFAYGNSLHAEFAFDDRYEILENRALRDLPAFLRTGLQAYPNRFVAYLTFAVNHRLGGFDPFGWHVTNLLVHLAASLLVYRLARLCFRAPLVAPSRLAASSRGVAFVAGALFATHPLGTQAVTYVVQRLTSLAALLYLLATVLYLSWRLADPDRRARRWLLYGGVLVSALLAVKTKEIAFTLPAALALVEWILFPRGGARRWLPIAPVAAIALLIPIAWIEIRAGSGGASLAGALDTADRATRLQTTASRMDYLRTQAAVVREYLRLLAWPTGQNLDHDFPVYGSWLAPRVLVSLGVLGSLLALAAWALHGTRPSRAGGPARLDPAWRLVALGIGWFFLALTVESSVIPIVDVIYEHRAYLPSAGIFLAIATVLGLGFQSLAPASVPRLLALAAVALGLLLGSLTLQRNAVWATPLTLWTDVVSKSPGKERPRQNLGETYDALGRLPEAEREFRAAIAINPGSVAARTSLAIVLQKSGRPAEAEAEYREVIRLDPRRHAAMFNLADLLWRQGRRDEAVDLYRRFLEVAPARDAGPRSVADARIRSVAGK